MKRKQQIVLNILAAMFLAVLGGACWWLFLQQLDNVAAMSFSQIPAHESVSQDAGGLE